MEVKECWKDVCGYEGLYQISNLGNIRSLEFRNNRGTWRRIKNMRPTDNGNGYLIVSLRRDGKRKNHYVHRMVAKAFCENPNAYDYVNHRDYDIRNNRADNLEWCTQKQNVRYSSERMKHPKSKCKPSNTGFKYIRKKGNSFVFVYRQKNIYKSFKTLKEAVTYRNEVV